MSTKPPYPPFNSEIGEYILTDPGLGIFEGRFAIDPVDNMPVPTLDGLLLQGDMQTSGKDLLRLSGDQSDVYEDILLLEGTY
jgi:hypothetical protein